MTDIKTLPQFARGGILNVLLVGWEDGDPDNAGLVLVDDLISGVAGAPTENETGTSYTLVFEDRFKYKRFTDPAGCAITVPAGIFAVDSIITLRSTSNGSTLVPDVGVTLNIPGLGSQPFFFQEAGSTVQIKQVAVDEWDVIGGIEGTI